MSKVLAILALVVMVLSILSGLFKKRGRKVERPPLLQRLIRPEDSFFLVVLAGILFLGLLVLLNRAD